MYKTDRENQGFTRQQIFQDDETDQDDKKATKDSSKDTGSKTAEKEGDGGGGAVTVTDDTLYAVSTDNAIIYNDKMEATTDKVPKWTEVKITQTKTENKLEYAYVKASDDSKEYGWILRKENKVDNLYSLSWNPKDNEDAYKKVSTAYNTQMQGVDPVANYKKLELSGSGTKDLIDPLYPNSTDANDLDANFKTKYEKLKTCFEANGIHCSPNAGLRHPLRSVIFNYAIAVRDASDTDKIQEANAVCKKYGIPIDWAHKNNEGTIDLDKSKSQAKIVCDAFGLGSEAARGVTDFGGRVSNHNSGKAVDVTLSFDFKDKKKITYNKKDFEVDPSLESGTYIKDIDQNQLTLLGKEASELSRNRDSDIIHWSETGN